MFPFMCDGITSRDTLWQFPASRATTFREAKRACVALYALPKKVARPAGGARLSKRGATLAHSVTVRRNVVRRTVGPSEALTTVEPSSPSVAGASSDAAGTGSGVGEALADSLAR